MKIHGIRNISYNNQNRMNNVRNNIPANNYNACNATNNVSFNYFNNITFTSIDNSENLRKLFDKDVPCMYCGKTMLSEEFINGPASKKILNGPISNVVKYIIPVQDSLHEKERDVFEIIKALAVEYPEINLHQALKTIEPTYEMALRVEQRPIFDELYELSSDLPLDAKKKFDNIMNETEKKLSLKPVKIPFSRREFIYKLDKICDSMTDKKMKNALTERANGLPDEKKAEYPIAKNQLSSIEQIENYIADKNFPEYDQIKDLCDISRKKINGIPVVIKFNRKSFIYKLNEALNNLKDKDLKEKFIKTADKLPTSKDNTSAFILKYADYPSSRIAKRLLKSSQGTIEHIKPFYKNGHNVTSNFAHACDFHNQTRQHQDLDIFIDKLPDVDIHIQNYIDFLIDISKEKDSFEKYDINPSHIIKISALIKTLSKNKLKPNINRLYE